MVDVTVIGAGGSTVTIQMTAAQNAAIAQTALWGISNLAAQPGLAPPNPNPNGVGILQQQNFAGSGTLPAPGNLLGGVVVQTAGDAGALTQQYVSAVVAATGNSTIVGPDNFKSTVATTDGSNTTYLNLSQQAEIYFGKGNQFLVQQDGATAYFDEGFSVLQTSAGATTQANLADNALLIVQGDGLSTVSANAGADIVVQVQGSSTIPVTVTGASTGGGTIQYLAASGNGIINPGSANTTVFGNVGNGKVTVFGGTGPSGATAAAFTGKLTVVEGQGYFAAGTAGGSQLFSSTVSGSATLQGGADGDLLFSMGAGQFLIAGAGSETLTGFNVAASVGGSIFQSGNGNATIFGNSGGGNTFAIGGGLTAIEGRNEDVLGAEVGAANTFYVVAAAGGGAGVGDFISGLDTFNMSITTAATGQTQSSLEFFTAGQSGSPFGTGSGTRLTLSGGTTVDFFGVEVKQTDIV